MRIKKLEGGGDPSGEIDVPLQAALACLRHQPQNVITFRLTGDPAIHNDQPGGGFGAGQFQEILPVAGDHDRPGSSRVTPDLHIIRALPQGIRHEHHLVTCLLQTARYFYRHILIKQEFHPFSSVV